MLTNKLIDQEQEKNQRTKQQVSEKVSFHECLQKLQGMGLYQKRLFIFLGFVWISASFFISIQYYLYKKPIYQGCKQSQNDCIETICQAHSQTDIKNYISPQNTLTYYFELFCGKQWLRIFFKILPQTLGGFGLFFYGKIADQKGRKTVIKITWRLYTLGVILYSVTKTMFLRSLGYIIASFHCFPALILTFVLFFEQNTEKTRNRGILLLWASLFIGPLVFSFMSQILFITKSNQQNPMLSITLIILLFNAIPALISNFFSKFICQSPTYVYPFNKIYAFNIINHIAQINKQSPILIDLSQSNWKKYKHTIHTGVWEVLKHKQWRKKITKGFFIMFTIYYSVKFSQVSLDPYTEAYLRGLVVNIGTAAADITLIIFIDKIRKRSLKIPISCCIFLLAAILFSKQENQVLDKILVLIAVLIRYFSEISYGILLIWIIQSFPTVTRVQCIGCILIGCSFSCAIEYSLKTYFLQNSIICLFLNVGALIVSRSINLSVPEKQKLPDTIDGSKFDKNDIYLKFN